MNDSPIVVFDFETTGLSPAHGDRAIEIGAVLLEANRVVASFQHLMNPGFRISSFIESYTGISNHMVRGAASCEFVMEQFAQFIGDYPLVAHNASFDKRFLDAEFNRIGIMTQNPLACSMLAARRVYPHAENHKLGTLVKYCDIPNDGTFHRALADAEMTSQLWVAMRKRIEDVFGIQNVSFVLMQQLSRIPKQQVSSFLKGRAVEKKENWAL